MVLARKFSACNRRLQMAKFLIVHPLNRPLTSDEIIQLEVHYIVVQARHLARLNNEAVYTCALQCIAKHRQTYCQNFTDAEYATIAVMVRLQTLGG